MNRKKVLIVSLAAVIVVAAGFALSRTASKNTGAKSGAVLNVVAGENFWGSLVAQIGGSKVHVLSVVSDPNADPHEYESNTATARAFATANYVVLNGAGYDSWGDKLLSSSNNPNRKVLTIATLVNKKDGDNPHMWYDPGVVNVAIAQMETDLAGLDPADATYFQAQLTTLKASLKTYQAHIAAIGDLHGGTKVAATEDIFAYLAQAAKLDLISPPAFTQAVAEGNDPPTASVAEFQQQLQSGQVKVLVYNTQTVTPLTESIKKLATSEHIPIVGISETIEPPTDSFQTWMNAELTTLQTALAQGVRP